MKPRSSLPGEASSQSPLVKAVTMLLIAGCIAAVLYGGFQYYEEKADVMENEIESKQPSFTGNSLDSPSSTHLDLKQNTDFSENDELTEGGSDSFTPVSDEEPSSQAEPANMADESIAENPTKENQQIAEYDVIEIYAENGSWMEVRDATRARLLYNMVPSGGSKVLQGKAPFHISMGNAKSTRVVINDIEIDITDYIRSNNTAIFTVSNEGENIIFH